MDFSIRDKLIAKCKIGSVEFVASACSGGGKRRLVPGGAIGVDGEEFEDLGEGARTEQIKAVVDEATYLELEAIRRDATAVDCTHPLFGIFKGRISDLAYDADPMQGVNVTLTLVEDGDHSRIMPPVQVSFPQASGAAAAACDAFAEGIDDLPDDIGSDLLGAATDCTGLIDGFVSALDEAAAGGLAAVQSLSGAFGELTDGVDALVDAFDSAAEDLASLVDSDLVDLALAAVDAGRTAVDALVSASSVIWQPLVTAADMGLDAVAMEFLGSSDDEAIDRLLAANPELIDTIALPPGVTVWLPV